MDYPGSGRHFHLSSLFLHKALEADLPAMFRDLKSAGLSLSLDTNDDPEDRWESGLDELMGLIDIFLPNEDEARRITGAADAESAATLLAQRVPVVVVKCGKNGALIRPGNQQWRVPAEPVTPLDTIGAGDSFNAGFLSAWLRGESLGVLRRFRQSHSSTFDAAGWGHGVFSRRGSDREPLCRQRMRLRASEAAGGKLREP